MTEKWNKKIAVVTGSSSGIGHEVFKSFASNGIVTVGLDINIGNTEALIKQLKEKKINDCYGYQCDISKEESVKEVFAKIEDKFGVIHIIVNNAGIGRKAKILDNDEQSLINMNKVIDTNFRGVLMCTRKAFHLISKSNDYGLIININSVAGHLIPHVSFPLNAYGASKYAVTGLNESIRQELFRMKNKKIRIAVGLNDGWFVDNSISPGFVDSNFISASGYFGPGISFNGVPMLKPSEIAKCVMFILSTPYEVSVSEMIVRSTGEEY